MKKKLFLVFVLAMALFFSCNTNDNPIPMVQVDIKLSINNAELASLQNPGGWAYVHGGVNGIFVYNFDNNTFYAYDRACPCNPKDAPLVYDESLHVLCHKDTVNNCNSQFNVIMRGSVQHGDSHYPIREYKVISQNGYLIIKQDLYL